MVTGAMTPRMKSGGWGRLGPSGFLGKAHAPFAPIADGADSLTLQGIQAGHFSGRARLLASLDSLKRQAEQISEFDGADAFLASPNCHSVSVWDHPTVTTNDCTNACVYYVGYKFDDRAELETAVAEGGAIDATEARRGAARQCLLPRSPCDYKSKVCCSNVLAATVRRASRSTVAAQNSVPLR